MKGGFGAVPEELKGLIRISPSALMEFAKTPKHFKHKYIDRKFVEPSKAMELGTAVHKAILEPDLFDAEYVRKPLPEEYDGALVTMDDIKVELEKLGLSKGGSKAAISARLREANPQAILFDDILAEAIGEKKPLTQAEWETCVGITESIKQVPDIHNFIATAEKEASAWWVHEPSGFVVSMRLDAYKRFGDGSILAVDVKTARSASRSYFEKQLWENWLFLQAAMYVDGLKQITGVECEHFAWVVVETSAPYCVEVYTADFGMLEAGRQTYTKMIQQMKECFDKGDWPSYNSGKITNISLPAWAWGRLEQWNEEQVK